MRSNRLMFRVANALALAVITLSLINSAAGASQLSPSVRAKLIARAEQVTGDKFPVTTSSPRGVTVFAVSAPSKEVLAAIDQGFVDLFAVAQRHGYRHRLNFSNYTVFIARADRTKDSAGQY